MKFLKSVPLLIVISLVLLLAACGGGGNSEKAASKEKSGDKKTFTIGVTHYSLQNEFPVLVSKAQKEKAKELGVELKFYDGNYDPSTQLEQFENMITQGVDAIIFSPVDAKAMAGAVEMAAAQGVPVIGVNTKVESKELTSYVGSNDVQAGEIEMQWMADKLGGKGNIVIIEGPLGSSAQIQRKEGIENILKKYPDIKVLATQTGNWSRQEGMDLMENWIQAFPGKINAVVSQNDEMAIGAINALEEAGLKDKVPVVGVDGISDALTAITEGRQDASVFQDAVGQGKMSVEIAVKYLKGEKVDKEYWIPFELVTPENVDKFK